MTSHSSRFKSKSWKRKMQSLRCFILCASLFSVACGPACRQKAPTVADANAPDDKADKIVVTVNGFNITESDIEALVKPELEKMAAKAKQLPANYTEQYKKQLRQWILDMLINEHLLAEQIKQAGIVVTEEEVINRIKEMAAAHEPPISLEDYKKILEGYGRSFDQYKDIFRKQMLYQKLIEPLWADKIKVTAEEAKNYYSDNPKEFEIAEQVRASHILIKPDTSDPNTDPNEAKARAKAKAEDLLKQIKAGADFAELARANSDCPSAANGGDLDFFPRGKMVPPFEKVAFELEPGQISDIVETRFGYHIIKVTDHKDASVTTFEQAKEDIINKLRQKKQSEFAKEYLESLKEKANIVYHDIETSPPKTATPR